MNKRRLIFRKARDGRVSEATVAEKKKKAAHKKPRFQHKVLVSILVPVVVFCIVTNLTIGALFGHELMMKKVDTERGYLSVIYSYLEDAKNNLDTLALYAEGSLAVRDAMKNSSLESVRAKRYALDAQEKLATALSASPVERYVDNMFLINRAGVKIVVTSGTGVVLTDQILESPLFEKAEKGRNAVAEITESVVDKGERKLSYLYPLDMEQNSFLYIEVSDRMITDLLAPYADAAEIVIQSTDTGDAWYSSPEMEEHIKDRSITSRYYEEKTEFMPFSLSVAVLIDAGIYSMENRYVFWVLLTTVILVICKGLAVSRLISRRITQPLGRLSSHINYLAETKLLTVDETIEKGEDEVAEIGREFNHLVRRINHLIEQQREMYEQKQKLSMDALQAQINPHFLYNTLDSVRWMAVIQNADNIANTVMSLENLLRNMAKGSGDKVTLREELSLVQDYVNLQQVRYMEVFDYICEVPEEYLDYLIVKMTMQPIIENAIVHGIEPTGTYGVIRVYARAEGGALYISIEDNGIGMDGTEIREILKAKKNKNSMSGIGVTNVDERLKLIYGPDYGLIFEGEEGKFTGVTIHIPMETGKEESDV